MDEVINQGMYRGEAVLNQGRMLIYMGSVNSELSKYPVDCFVDITRHESMSVYLDLKDYGHVSYPLINLPSSYLNSALVRYTVRAYEDFVLGRLERGLTLSHAENEFYEDWLLSKRA